MMKPMAIHIANLRPVFSHTANDRMHPEKAPRLYIETWNWSVSEERVESP